MWAVILCYTENMKKHHCKHCNERIKQINITNTQTRWVSITRWNNPEHGNPFTCTNRYQTNTHQPRQENQWQSQ